MRASSSAGVPDDLQRLGERSVSYRRSPRSRPSAALSDDEHSHGSRLGSLSQGRQNELANTRTGHGTKEAMLSAAAGVNREAHDQATHATTPTRIMKTPPTKVRQRLSRTSGTPASPTRSPQEPRAAVEKSRPEVPLFSDAVEIDLDEEADEIEEEVGEEVIAERATSPLCGSSLTPRASAQPAVPSAALLSATFDTTIIFAGTRANPPQEASRASSTEQDGVEDSQWRRQRALTAAKERHQTWKQIQLSEQLRRRDATCEEVEETERRLEAVKVDKRRLEDKLRGIEELHVLADMLEEKRIRTKARAAKRESLENIWQQLQLLCGATSTGRTEDADINADGQDNSSNDDDRAAQHDQTTTVHEYSMDDDDDDVEAEAEAAVSVGPRQSGRAASPEVFAFPCNRQSVSFVHPSRVKAETRSRSRGDGDAATVDANEDDLECTPSMEPLDPLSPEEAPLLCLSDGGGEAGSGGGSHLLEPHNVLDDGDEDLPGDAEEQPNLQARTATEVVQPSATHRCKQEHLRLGRDPSASRARSVSMAASVKSADPREVLTNFLAELLFEVEELAQVCIQVPAPCAQRHLATVLRRRVRQRHGGNTAALKRGFFSFFGGATESHLSAKPLATFLTGVRRLASAGWLMEQKLQLLARELSTDAEEDALRTKMASLLTQSALTVADGADPVDGVVGAESLSSKDEERADVAPASPPAVDGDEVSKSLFSSSPTSQDEEGTEDGILSMAPPPPPLPRPSRQAVVQGVSDAVDALIPLSSGAASPPPVGLEAVLPSIAYALPRLTTVSDELNQAQSQVQVAYKVSVDAEKQRRRDFIRRLKEVYRTVEAPALRRELRRLRWAQQQLTEALVELGITHLVLEWNVRRPLRYVPMQTDATDTRCPSRATALLVDAASDVRLYGGSPPPPATVADEVPGSSVQAHGGRPCAQKVAALCRRRVSIRIPVSTVIRASLGRHQRPQQPSQEGGGRPSSSYRTSTSVAGTEEAQAAESVRTSAANATAGAPATATGLQTIAPRQIATLGRRPSSGVAAARLTSPRVSTATEGIGGGGEHSTTSRASSSFARVSGGAADSEEAAGPLVGSADTPVPRHSTRSRSCYFKKEVIERHARERHASPVKVVRVTYRSSDSIGLGSGGDNAAAGAVSPARERVVVVEEQETELAPALISTAALVRGGGGGDGEGNDSAEGGGSNLLRLTSATAVITSPELLEQESAMASGAVRATMRFCGEAAVRRREAEEAAAARVREAWQLREELARVEEANYLAAREVAELEADLDRVAAERQEKLYEARTKLNATKAFFGVLRKEHEEWSTILTDLRQVIASGQEEAMRQPSSSSVSAPPSTVRRDRRRPS